jgi:CRISPR-associated endonuclease Cas1
MDKEHGTRTNIGDGDPPDALEMAFARDAENPAVCVVDGYGVRLTTSSGRLVVSDGIGRRRRQRVYGRAVHGLSRVVVMGTTGHVTLDAIRWLDGAGVGSVILDPTSGTVVSASTAVANDDARLRRAQALAMGTETGLDVARYLTDLKLAGQAFIAEDELASDDTARAISKVRSKMADSASLEEMRQLEASAANLYWAAWQSVEVMFVRNDEPRVPENWRRFEGRRSAINPGSSRNASDPLNALLNYVYRLLEAEGHLATLAIGLDPGLGILHADIRGRASFVLDVIEAARPLAERHVLRLLRSQPLRWRDFHENDRGGVKVLAPLSHRLAEAMPGFGASLAPVVEHVAVAFAAASPYKVSMPSVLTKEKHLAAARRRIQSAEGGSTSVGPGTAGVAPRMKRRRKPPPEQEAALPLPICKGCGAVITPEIGRRRPRGAYCSECLARRRAELGAYMPAASQRRRAEFKVRTGASPTHSPEASERRRRGNTRRRADQAAWEAEHGSELSDPEWFRSAVLPSLASVTLAQIAHAAGISTSAASKIRAGSRLPHPRHWSTLADLAGVPAPPVAARSVPDDDTAGR